MIDENNFNPVFEFLDDQASVDCCATCPGKKTAMQIAAYGIGKTNITIIRERFYHIVNNLVLLGVPINITKDTMKTIISNILDVDDYVYLMNILDSIDSIIWTEVDTISECFTTSIEMTQFLQYVATIYSRVRTAYISTYLPSLFWVAYDIFKFNLAKSNLDMETKIYLVRNVLKIGHGEFCYALLCGCDCDDQPNCASRDEETLRLLVEGWYDNYSTTAPSNIVQQVQKQIHKNLNEVSSTSDWEWAKNLVFVLHLFSHSNVHKHVSQIPPNNSL